MVKGAVQANCAKDGYTGCHLYRITAESSQTVAAASLRLATLGVTLAKTGNTTQSDWQYVVVSGNAADTGTTVSASDLAFLTGDAATPSRGDMSNFAAFDMHNGAGMTAGQKYVYYLLVFLNDDGESQNSDDTNNSTGTYEGTVTLAAAGSGEVTATFSNYTAG